MRTNEAFRQELNHAIDFNTVLTQIASFASFSCSRKAIESALPMDNLPAIHHELSLAKEGLEYEKNGGVLSLKGISDIQPFVVQASKGMNLQPDQLIKIAGFLHHVKNASRSFDEQIYPLLHETALTLDWCPNLCSEIESCIDLSGQIKEDATRQLAHLYKTLSKTKNDLAARGKSFVKANSASLMENMTTYIGGRLCVLVKAGQKNKFGGMIHGSSQSGMAFYVEAGEFVELNNEVQSLQGEIEEEKRRITRHLSGLVKNRALELQSDQESMEVIDIALSKGKWCVSNDGCIPMVSSSAKGIRLEHCIHPLLEPKSAVPNSYALNGTQKILMISGPNMGGKTVTLKTIGLFVALAQAGFPVSAYEASLPFFTSIWTDIGDRQSIENNLSTFSSHISRLSEITSSADEHTFILLDETGNGTEPQQGAAIAQAVLEFLLDKKSTVITSTHYNELKAFGKSSEGILVSSVEFDPQTLKPTYRYLPGISGSSYAFDIARQFKLDEEILQRARQLKKENEPQSARELEKLEKLQQQVLVRKDRFDALIANAHQIQREAEKEKELWQKKRAELDQEYSKQLSEMIDQSKEEAKSILKELRQVHGPVHEGIALMGKLDGLNKQTENEAEPAGKPISQKREFQPGDYVRVEILNGHGEILSLKKKKALVEVNGKRIEVSIDQLTPMKRPKASASVSAKKERVYESFSPELNLIGMRVEEAMQQLDHYLDQALARRIKTVRIIHGMGTGALRKAVWQDLSKRNTIKSYEAAGPNQGGLGATIVEFK